MLQMPTKDPGEVLDYSIDWTAALAGDTIAASVWSVTSGGIIVNSSSIASKIAIVWLSFGVAGVNSIVKNTITTTGGRKLVQSLQIPIASL